MSISFTGTSISSLVGTDLYSSLQVLLVNLQPGRNKTAAGYLQDVFVSLITFVFLFDFDHIAGLNQVGRDVYALAVYKYMLVVYDLSCFFSGSAKIPYGTGRCRVCISRSIIRFSPL